MIQLRRWFPSREIRLVVDGAFATASLAIWSLKLKIGLTARLKMNASLYSFCRIAESQGKIARGMKLFSFKEMLLLEDIWTTAVVEWYGGVKKTVQYVTVTCLWGASKGLAIPIRMILIRDPEGRFDPVPLMSTAYWLGVEVVIQEFVKRWNIEVTFRDCREHLGIETQRQWSFLSIARATPCLFAVYSFVVLLADYFNVNGLLSKMSTAWYEKTHITFSDLLRFVRRNIWSYKLRLFGDLRGEEIFQTGNG
jgi:hypothetical protein